MRICEATSALHAVPPATQLTLSVPVSTIKTPLNFIASCCDGPTRYSRKQDAITRAPDDVTEVTRYLGWTIADGRWRCGRDEWPIEGPLAKPAELLRLKLATGSPSVINFISPSPGSTHRRWEKVTMLWNGPLSAVV